MNEPSLLQTLTETVGESNIVADAAREAFRVTDSAPDAVVSPASVEELSQVMAACHASNAVVAAWGGGTQQRLGCPLDAHGRPFVVVRTHRLNRVLNYTPADMAISVEAGMTMSQLRDLLAPNAQMLPFDVPLPDRATIGGCIATASDGPRRLGYGTFRDLLVGVKVVEATGRVSKAGGIVVKNVSGFDMMKLYHGSLGTLAIVVGANFKLIPRPRAAASLVCGFASQVEAFKLADAIHASQLTPAAVELVDAGSAQTSRPLQFAPDARRVYLVVRVENLPQAVERHVRDITQLARDAGATSLDVLRDREHEVAWAEIADLAQIADVADDEMVLRASCLPSQLGATLFALGDLARQAQLACSMNARALNGVAFVRARDGAAGAKLAQFLGAARKTLSDVEIVALASAAPVDVWDSPSEGIETMRRVKREFDPTNMLNPGRFVV